MTGRRCPALFRELLFCRREIVLDGEIAVPDDRGVTQMGVICAAVRLKSAKAAASGAR
jgi:hypothetical protein